MEVKRGLDSGTCEPCQQSTTHGGKNIERTGGTDGFCDIRAKAIIMKAHRTREKKKKKKKMDSNEQHVRG